MYACTSMAHHTDRKQQSLFDCCASAAKKRTEPVLNSASGSSSTDPQLAGQNMKVPQEPILISEK